MQVSAGAAALMTVAAMAPCLVALWRQPEAPRIPRACAYAALCGFMFGFHVHEKAALPVIVLLALDAPLSCASGRCASLTHPQLLRCVFNDVVGTVLFLTLYITPGFTGAPTVGILISAVAGVEHTNPYV